MNLTCQKCGAAFARKGFQPYCSRTCANRVLTEKLIGSGQPAETRFWAKVTKTDQCWLWAGSSLPSGYGHFRPDNRGKTWLSHRFAYTITYGPIAEGLEIHHRCENPTCVRPDHLLARSRKDHGKEHVSQSTHCKRGHEWTQENTYRNRRGSRECRACHRLRERGRYTPSKRADTAAVASP